jgi:hypothetical protein
VRERPPVPLTLSRQLSNQSRHFVGQLASLPGVCRRRGEALTPPEHLYGGWAGSGPGTGCKPA